MQIYTNLISGLRPRLELPCFTAQLACAMSSAAFLKALIFDEKNEIRWNRMNFRMNMVPAPMRLEGSNAPCQRSLGEASTSPKISDQTSEAKASTGIFRLIARSNNRSLAQLKEYFEAYWHIVLLHVRGFCPLNPTSGMCNDKSDDLFGALIGQQALDFCLCRREEVAHQPLWQLILTPPATSAGDPVALMRLMLKGDQVHFEVAKPLGTGCGHTKGVECPQLSPTLSIEAALHILWLLVWAGIGKYVTCQLHLEASRRPPGCSQNPAQFCWDFDGPSPSPASRIEKPVAPLVPWTVKQFWFRLPLSEASTKISA